MVSLFLSFCLSFFSRRRQKSRQYNTDRGASTSVASRSVTGYNCIVQ